MSLVPFFGLDCSTRALRRLGEGAPSLQTARHAMAVRSSAVIVANWLAFLSLFSAFLMLMLHGIKYKGPGRKHKYFHGFREQNM